MAAVVAWHVLTGAAMVGMGVYTVMETPLMSADVALAVVWFVGAFLILVTHLLWWLRGGFARLQRTALDEAASGSAWYTFVLALVGVPDFAFDVMDEDLEKLKEAAGTDRLLVPETVNAFRVVVARAAELQIAGGLTLYGFALFTAFLLDGLYSTIWATGTKATVGVFAFIAAVLFSLYVSQTLAFRSTVDSFIPSALGFVLCALVWASPLGTAPALGASLFPVFAFVAWMARKFLVWTLKEEPPERHWLNLGLLTLYVCVWAITLCVSGYTVTNGWLYPALAVTTAWFGYWALVTAYVGVSETWTLVVDYARNVALGFAWIVTHLVFVFLLVGVVASSPASIVADRVGQAAFAFGALDIVLTFVVAFRYPTQAIDAALVTWNGALMALLMNVVPQISTGYIIAFCVLLVMFIIIVVVTQLPWMRRGYVAVPRAVTFFNTMVNAIVAYALWFAPHRITGSVSPVASAIWGVIQAFMGVVATLVAIADVVDWYRRGRVSVSQKRR